MQNRHAVRRQNERRRAVLHFEIAQDAVLRGRALEELRPAAPNAVQPQGFEVCRRVDEQPAF